MGRPAVVAVTEFDRVLRENGSRRSDLSTGRALNFAFAAVRIGRVA